MAEGNTSDELSKSRTVLGDLTNSIGKRGYLKRGKNGIESSDINDKDVVKRRCASPRPCTEINSLERNVISGISKIHNENEDPNVSDFGSGYAVSKSSIDVDAVNVMDNSKVDDQKKDIKILDFTGGDVVSEGVNELDVVDKIDHSIARKNDMDPSLADLEGDRAVEKNTVLEIDEVSNESKCPILDDSDRKDVVEFELGSAKVLDEENGPNLLDLCRGNAIKIEANDELSESFPANTSRTVSETGGDCLRDGINYYANVDEHNAENFVFSHSTSVEGESSVFGVDRTTKRTEDECADMSGGIDTIKSCSCSFCTKAARILLDLHRQDIKARISAIKKSQKEASILAARSCRIKFTERHCSQSFNGVSNLEPHLIYQWRSLFQRMADVWEEESNQLEASLLPLIDLREKCETDLASID